MKRWLLPLLLIPGCLFGVSTTYVFDGAAFNDFVGASCPLVCHLTGSFTTAAPLAPNLNQDVGGSGAFVPVSFTFTDGVTTITKLNATSSGFAVHTDANGNIVQWGMYMSGPSGGAGIFLFWGGAGSLAQNGINISAYQAYYMSAASTGGTWRMAGVNSGDIVEVTKSYTDSATPLAITWTPAFPDLNYTATCTAETTPSDFLLPTITSRSANGMTVSPTDGGSPAGVLDCLSIPDSDATDVRHGREAFAGFPASVTVPWTVAFANTNYTAVCTVETEGDFGAGFTGVIEALTPASVTVNNAGYASRTIHCMGVPDSDTGPVRHARTTFANFPNTVTVTWNVPFPDVYYVATCKEQQTATVNSDSAIAIQAGSKRPGSMTVINETAGGTIHCLAAHISGDVNGDGVVDCGDLDAVKAAFGKKQGQAGFNAAADVNGDGVVNIVDLTIVGKQVPAGTVCQ